MITIRQPTAGVAEAFRLLQTLLQLGTSEPSPRTVLVTSAGVGEGKTLVAANLAVVAAQRGKSVILVDADLQRPGIHRLFDLPNDIGLTDLLRLDHTLLLSKGSDLLRPVPNVPNLWVLPSGPLPEPAPELLSSDHAAEVLQILPKLVDIVIYDTAPANAVAATLVLARQVDGVIVVARCMQTRPVALQHLGNRLRRIGAHILGGVLNAVPGDGLSSYSSGSDGRGAQAGDGIPDPLLDGRAATAGV